MASLRGKEGTRLTFVPAKYSFFPFCWKVAPLALTRPLGHLMWSLAGAAETSSGRASAESKVAKDGMLAMLIG